MKTAIVASVSPTSFEALALSSDVKSVFKLATEYGFDAVEIAVRDPGFVSAGDILKLAADYGIKIAAIGTGQAYVDEGLSLTNPDSRIREQALTRLKMHLELGSELNAGIIIGLIRGTAKDKKGVAESLDLLAETISLLGSYAKEVGAPGLLLEPINRYETRLLNSVEEVIRFLERVDDLSVRILADTFHMNIEDRDMAASIGLAGDLLGHVHFADSNRWAPGQGHIDFVPIFNALKTIKYSGYLSAEILPEPSPDDAVRLTAEFFKMNAAS